MAENRFFIETDTRSRNEKGESTSGDVLIQKRSVNRRIIVLSDGAGTGVKARIVAEVIASMVMNYVINNDSIERAAATIVRTFGEMQDDMPGATFTILDINESGRVSAVEFDNPPYTLLREGKNFPVRRRKIETGGRFLLLSTFEAVAEDRIILVSDGITSSGNHTGLCPDGWPVESINSFCNRMVGSEPLTSAQQLCAGIISQAVGNDLGSPRSDMSCAVVYFRQPRRIMICSGPPFNDKKDLILADLISNYPGTRLVCGGTTAKIIARELEREIKVVLRRDPAGLPPVSMMHGVDLITEGVLTLSRVKSLLEKSPDTEITREGTDGDICRMLLGHDIIEFVVGTRINPLHQDPNLPVELELRRNLIKDLAYLLENKFMKEVKVQYI